MAKERGRASRQAAALLIKRVTYVYGGSRALLSTLSPLPQEQEAVRVVELSLRSAGEAGRRCKPARAASGFSADERAGEKKRAACFNLVWYFGECFALALGGVGVGGACPSPPKR